MNFEYVEPVLLRDILPFVMADLERRRKVSFDLVYSERIRRRCFEIRRRPYLRRYIINWQQPGDRQRPWNPQQPGVYRIHRSGSERLDFDFDGSGEKEDDEAKELQVVVSAAICSRRSSER